MPILINPTRVKNSSTLESRTGGLADVFDISNRQSGFNARIRFPSPSAMQSTESHPNNPWSEWNYNLTNSVTPLIRSRRKEYVAHFVRYARNDPECDSHSSEWSNDLPSDLESDSGPPKTIQERPKPEPYHDEPSAANDEDECVVCMDRAARVRAAPCNHRVMCVTCCRAYKDPRCPVCRRLVGFYYRTHTSS